MKLLPIPLLLMLITESGVGQTAADDSEYVLDPDTQITLRKGFDAELLYTVPASQGSWVAMAFDPKGRITVSDQDDKGVFRVTLADERDSSSELRVESLDGFPYVPVAWGRRTVGGALGFVHAFDSLYMSSMKGFYRIRDTNGDDTYDEFTLLKTLEMGWEHSAHSIIKTEDGAGLYLVSGNHSRVPEGVDSLQPPVWKLDSLLPAMPDPQGHATGVRAPGGWICRISPDGKDWTMIASGLRNPVDLAINREGELFTYDSDLEFDVGSPWYRPTRINHVTSASEFGWRTGSAKWPEYFADSNGAVINMGPGSPTGISFGYESNFPYPYQDRLFVCDWTFGTIFTIEMEESGSSYTGTQQEFLNGEPLNIAAMRFGPDGHMYFVVGGRNTDSKLYRVRYTGPAREGSQQDLVANQTLRDLRHSLEAFHGSNLGGVAAIETAWPYLSHEDRNIRYAARLAIENQDLELWQERGLAESEPRAAIYSAIALSRHAAGSIQSNAILEKLNRIPFTGLGHDDQLALLRAYSLCLLRLDGMEAAAPRALRATLAKLESLYPVQDAALDTELCRVLCYLDSEAVAGKTIDLMQVTRTQALAYDKTMLARHEYGKAILETMANTPNVQNIHYAYSLRRVQRGWSLDDRKFYFNWLNDTLQKSGGKSFAGYIRAIREDAIEHLPLKDAVGVASLLVDIESVNLSDLPIAQGPPVGWTTESAMRLFDSKLRGRDYDNGKKMFSAGRCAACHRFQGAGGLSGPGLGSVGKRYSIRDIVVSICEPSDSISEQYQASLISLKDGEQLYGRLIYKNDQEIAVATNPYDLSKLSKAPIGELLEVEVSQVSMMPPGTVFPMNEDELRDLIAYLVSGGNPRHKVFKK